MHTGTFVEAGPAAQAAERQQRYLGWQLGQDFELRAVAAGGAEGNVAVAELAVARAR